MSSPKKEELSLKGSLSAKVSKKEAREFLFGDPEFRAALLGPAPDIRTRVLDWYRYIPHMRSQKFPPFLVASRELAVMLFKEYEIEIKLTSDTSVALADVANKTINLPNAVFETKTLRKRFGEYEQWYDFAPEITATVNGLILHEAAHFRKSPPTILDIWLSFATSGTASKYKLPSALTNRDIQLPMTLSSLINIVEDLFIEAWIESSFPNLYHFIEAAHEFYFSNDELDNRVDGFVAEVGTPMSVPLDLRRRLNILDILIALKNTRMLAYEFKGCIGEFVSLMRDAQEAGTPVKRAEIAYLMFMKLFNLEEMQVTTIELQATRVGSSSQNTQLDAQGRESTGIPGNADRGKERKPSETSDKEGDEKVSIAIGKEFDKRVEQNRERNLEDTLSKTIRPVKVIRDMPPSSHRASLLLPAFSQLGTKLRYVWTTNYAPGPAHKRGPVLVNQRLYRIATDQKIFSYREKRKATGRNYEICILVDASGSMFGAKIQNAMQAAFTAWKSLRSARVATCLMAHSSEVDSPYHTSEIPAIWIIADYNEQRFDLVEKRALQFLDREAKIGLKNNYDGFAINAAIKHGFTKMKDVKRYLFVISDGEPAGLLYSGEPAKLHTRGAVREARAKGIDVISITVDCGAFRVNDFIYGPAKNVKTSSPSVLDELIEAMFVRHEGGRE